MLGFERSQTPFLRYLVDRVDTELVGLWWSPELKSGRAVEIAEQTRLGRSSFVFKELQGVHSVLVLV